MRQAPWRFRRRPFRYACALFIFLYATYPLKDHQRGSHLRCDTDWLGIPQAQNSGSIRSHIISIQIVVAYCDGDLEEVWTTIRQLEQQSDAYVIREVYLYSKCSTALTLAKAPPHVRIIHLSNVGRCDHTYLHHIVSTLYRDESRKPSDVVVFLKDSNTVHQPGYDTVSVDAMLQRAATKEVAFACGLMPGSFGKYRSLSSWHDAKTLLEFKKSRYRNVASMHEVRDKAAFEGDFRNMKEWLEKTTKISTPRDGDIIQVCYGGVFATSVYSIRRWEHSMWVRLKHSLERGDNIEESHFMERTWAYLLSPSPSAATTRALIQMSRGIIERYSRGLLGTLYGCASEVGM